MSYVSYLSLSGPVFDRPAFYSCFQPLLPCGLCCSRKGSLCAQYGLLCSCCTWIQDCLPKRVSACPKSLLKCLKFKKKKQTSIYTFFRDNLDNMPLGNKNNRSQSLFLFWVHFSIMETVFRVLLLLLAHFEWL